MSVDVNFAALRGVIPASLIVFYSTPEQRSRVTRQITDYVVEELFLAELGDPQVGVFAVNVPNVPRLEDIGDWVRRLPGVRACRTLVLLDITPVNIMGEGEMEKMTLAVAHPPIPSTL